MKIALSCLHSGSGSGWTYLAALPVDTVALHSGVKDGGDLYWHADCHLYNVGGHDNLVYLQQLFHRVAI